MIEARGKSQNAKWSLVLRFAICIFTFHFSAVNTSISLGAAQAERLKPRFQRGVNFYNAKGGAAYGSGPALAAMQQLKNLGVDTLTFIPFGVMKTTNSPMIEYGEDPQAPDQELVKSILDAKRLGLRVLLKPHLWIPGSWPGDVAMENRDDWKVWFHNYKRFITHYASIAEKTGCEFFSVGNELRAASIREEWPEVIQAARKAFRGRLLYAAHWDGEYLWAPWDKLDMVGINFYFPLASRLDPPYQEIQDSLTRIKTYLETFARSVGRPLIFTEVGFRPVKEAAMKPWESYEENPNSPIDLMAQLKAYLAFYAVFKDADWLNGVHWWLAYSDPQMGGPKDADFNFLGKPAEGIVKLWFSGR